MAKRNSDNDIDKFFNDKNFRNKKNPPKKKSNGKFILIGLLIFISLILLFGAYIISGLPSLEELENPKPQLASKVFTSDGELLGQFFIENRIETNVDSIPQHFKDALIATEDRKFYSHWGVDVDRFIKAMIKNIMSLSMREGASTITQQLAKNLYKLQISNESTFDKVIRKIREWFTAIQIEKNYTKDEILELYLNVSYFGRSAYGIETAANIFFNKRAFDLTIEESALLVALLKSSVFYDPIRRPENALNRRNLVMYNMVDAGYLDRTTYEVLRTIPLLLAEERIGRVKTESPHFLEEVRKQMLAMSDKYNYDLFRDGLNIYTTLDMRMQKIANKAVEEHLNEYQSLFNKSWSWDRNSALLANVVDKAIRNNTRYRAAVSTEDKALIYNQLKSNSAFVDSVKKAETRIQVGFVVIDTKTGHIKSMVGGADQDFLYGLNHVTQIRRQPGSAFKPIIYTVAIDNGYFPAYSILNERRTYDKGWSPRNFSPDYGGYQTMRQALAKSTNVIAVSLIMNGLAPLNQIGTYSQRLGIKTKLDVVPAIALGTGEVTPLELTAAYGTLANGGIYIEPISILRIEDRNGVLIDQFSTESREAISEQTAGIITNMMQDVINYGTAARTRQFFHRPAAGKTGTTQEFADAWFVGFTPQLVGGVWVGFDDRRVSFRGSDGQGGRAALPIWYKFMAEAYKELDIPLEYFDLPPGVETARFCRYTIESLGDAKLATDNCPGVITDIINTRKRPATCDIHRGGSVRQERSSDSEW